MTSSINPNHPETGEASTEEVRNNFAAAKAEIEALQTALANVPTDITNAVVAVVQQEGQPVPERPEALVVHWYTWGEPPISPEHPYDQWYQIAEITEPGIPAAPTGLSAVGADAVVSLSWTRSTSSGGEAPTGQRLYRNTENSFSGATQLGSDLSANANSYSDESVENGTQYYYWVTAFNSEGESSPSTHASATPEAVGDIETFVDDFDRPDELLAESPDWEDHEGAIMVESGTARASSPYSSRSARMTGSVSPNQYAEIDIVNHTTGNSSVFPLVRVQSSGSNWYGLDVKNDGSWQLLRRVSGNSTTLDSGTVSLSLPVTARIEVQGSELRAYIDGNLVATESDTQYSDGAPGMRIYADPDTAAVQIDEFRGGAL
ncbi:hypothetical protein CAI21_22105 [Alkalilimnicola ehrlichii]|uniref:Fibronectin type-III domain-containing protein n=1 Tax=Alkalilimnicola ehrlichii TaxID=351052 RepID=A0A3E0WQ86_9GAMM|nr:fibronectin type III domain-containing protein [Alkalilimnicola ehrlichii]RFA24321.1 hypothetical protein CAI21_22105 [Alkalilimnicola ehrlichii]RFA35122.1 hypothetical protein CAL65_13525 [Alkalilimnicola ehrlichii]